MSPKEREEFIKDVATAIRAADPVLTEEEVQYVRMALEKQAQSIKLRQAVIEKTLSGLAWAFVVGVFYLVVEWAKNHGYKP